MTSLKENLTLWLFGSDNLMMVEQQRPYVQCKIALTSFRCYIIDKITITIRMCNVICAGAIFREKKTVCVHCLRLVCVRVFLALPSLFSWRIRNVTIFFFFFFFLCNFFSLPIVCESFHFSFIHKSYLWADFNCSCRYLRNGRHILPDVCN